MSAADFVVGEKVEVHASGSWYPGVVERVTPKRLAITYHTRTGRERKKIVNPESIVGGSVRGVGLFEGPLVRKVPA
jgi:hypothetical protein